MSRSVSASQFSIKKGDFINSFVSRGTLDQIGVFDLSYRGILHGIIMYTFIVEDNSCLWTCIIQESDEVWALGQQLPDSNCAWDCLYHNSLPSPCLLNDAKVVLVSIGSCCQEVIVDQQGVEGVQFDISLGVAHCTEALILCCAFLTHDMSTAQQHRLAFRGRERSHAKGASLKQILLLDKVVLVETLSNHLLKQGVLTHCLQQYLLSQYFLQQVFEINMGNCFLADDAGTEELLVSNKIRQQKNKVPRHRQKRQTLKTTKQQKKEGIKNKRVLTETSNDVQAQNEQISKEDNISYQELLNKGKKEKKKLQASQGKLINQGLPNVGNTCYLNSALQMVFAMEKVTSHVINRAGREPALPFHQLVGQILQALKTGSSARHKEPLLQALAREVQRRHPSIRFKGQHDVVEALSLLLGELESEEPRVFALMTVKYHKVCDCKRDFVYESAFVKLSEACGDCGKKVGFEVVAAAPYLCLVESEAQEDYRQELTLKAGERLLRFENIFFTGYWGNSDFGHYWVCRRAAGQWLQISDNTVSELSPSRKPSKMPRVCLYRFVVPSFQKPS